MGVGFLLWIIVVSLQLTHGGVSCSSVKEKIYVELKNTVPCVRLLNATHQIGCQSSISGDTGVIHVLENDSDLDWVLTSGPNPPYMLLMEARFFSRDTMLKLKGSPRVAGVAVIISNAPPAQGFSPHHSCPNQDYGVYSSSYGPDMAGCNVTMWNPLGSGLSYEDFNFPVFSLTDDNNTGVIRKCFQEHNVGVNGSAPQYPLCAMQLFSHMHAVTNTATCMRRNNIQNKFSLSSEIFCDALGDSNVWGSIRPLNISTKGHKVGESVVIAATRLDSRSFFWEVAPGGESSVSGFITLLAAAQALRGLPEEALPPHNILYSFFQGEAFDYIGSSRMVFDMERKEFVIDLDNVHSVLEVGQVALRQGNQLWLHSDPVSRRNVSIDSEVKTLISNMQSASSGLSVSLSEPPVTQPLPPSSFQRFLRARAIPGIVLADHQFSFNNRYYESRYDDAEYLNVTYPSTLTPEEQLDTVTETAKALADVATCVARSLYKQAGGDDARLPIINVDVTIVTRMLYGFLVRSNNSWFQSLLGPEFQGMLGSDPMQFYVGVSSIPNKANAVTRLVQYILANLTGSATNLTKSQCQNPEGLEGESRELYSYLWVQGRPNSTESEAYCVRAAVRLTKAVSPAFDLEEYSSSNYSTWTESRWKHIGARIFLVASRDLEMLTLGVGVAILILSLLGTYFISSKADLLFTTARESSSSTY